MSHLKEEYQIKLSPGYSIFFIKKIKSCTISKKSKELKKPNDWLKDKKAHF